ncbi:MAG: hypothetical protein KC592_03765 [Nitrospira sp.]|nr:hypothetical protein [Nitrospira sp.]HBP86794.1 hypothetical protein [Nitrospiraceae bacterium]HNP27796.1 hypothetical protein [Nitrospirales bacterium]
MVTTTTKHFGWRITMLFVSCLSLFMWYLPAGAESSKTPAQSGHPPSEINSDSIKQHNQYNLLPGHRIITGVVEGVAADQAKVNSGDTGDISPRYLSLERAKDKGFTLKEGDKVTIVVNDKNHVVDYHLANGETESHHKVLKGRLAQPLKVGQEHAVIKTEDGQEQSFPVRPLARSEVAAIPLDTDGLFLLDETNKISSATLTKDVKSENDWARSPAKNVYRHIEGVIKDKPKKHSLTIQTQDKESITLSVWDYLQEEMTELSGGTPVTVLVDQDNKVVDIAHLPQNKEE